MNDKELTGKKIYYRESELGKVVSLKSYNNKKVAIVEISNNDFKAIPLDYVSTISNRLGFNSDRMIIDNFPVLSSRDIENNPEKVKQALIEHYGEPDHWRNSKGGFDSDKDNAYMGSSQITDQEPQDNESLKDKVDYDKIRHGKDEDQ